MKNKRISGIISLVIAFIMLFGMVPSFASTTVIPSVEATVGEALCAMKLSEIEVTVPDSRYTARVSSAVDLDSGEKLTAESRLRPASRYRFKITFEVENPREYGFSAATAATINGASAKMFGYSSDSSVFYYEATTPEAVSVLNAVTVNSRLVGGMTFNDYHDLCLRTSSPYSRCEVLSARRSDTNETVASNGSFERGVDYAVEFKFTAGKGYTFADYSGLNFGYEENSLPIAFSRIGFSLGSSEITTTYQIKADYGMSLSTANIVLTYRSSGAIYGQATEANLRKEQVGSNKHGYKTTVESVYDLTAGKELKLEEPIKKNHEIRFTFTLRAKCGYTFDKTSQVLINNEAAKIVSFTPEELTVEFDDYFDGYVKYLEFDLPHPAAGVPVLTAYVRHPEYISSKEFDYELLSVSDRTAGGTLEDTDTFKEGHVYRYGISISASKDADTVFAFSRNFTARINGKFVDPQLERNNTSVYLYVDLVSTKQEITELSAEILPPSDGMTVGTVIPALTSESAETCRLKNVRWYDAETNHTLLSSDTFTEGKAYRLCFDVEKYLPYAFTSDTSLTLNGDSRSAYATPDNKTISFSFDFTVKGNTVDWVYADVYNFVNGKTPADLYAGIPADEPYYVEYIEVSDLSSGIGRLLPPDEKFVGGKNYQLHLHVKMIGSDNGTNIYKFADEIHFHVNEVTYFAYAVNHNLEADFYNEIACGVEKIKIVNVNIDTPVEGYLPYSYPARVPTDAPYKVIDTKWCHLNADGTEGPYLEYSEPFVKGQSYRAVIDIEITGANMDLYEFDDAAKIYVNGRVGKTWNLYVYGIGTGFDAICTGETAVTALCADYQTPSVGEKVSSFKVENPSDERYDISWTLKDYEGNLLKDTDTFKAGELYTVEFTFSSKAPYTIDSERAAIYINRASVKPSEAEYGYVRVLITFEADAPSIDNGDVDGDGSVTLNDAMYIINDVAKKTPLSDDYRSRADVDYDNEITLNDAMYIINYVAKKSDTVGPAE